MRVARSKEELLSLIAKLIVWGENRATAIARMKRSLDEFVIEGIKTTIDFHKKLSETSVFIERQVHTKFIEQELLMPARQAL
ncbi:MAG: hypothetical protein AB1700_19515 [Bacillota bacterium]